MQDEKEEDRVDISLFLRETGSTDNIEKLSAITKDFLKKYLKLRYEVTFPEIEEAANKKRISPRKKSNIIEICKKFESLGYQQTKPTKRQLAELKEMLRALTTEEQEQEEVPEKEKPSFFGSLLRTADKVRKKNQQYQRIAKKIEWQQQDMKHNILEKIKEKKRADIDVKKIEELKAIGRFINVSLGTGLELEDIIDELKEMGFNPEDIKNVVENIQPNQ